MIIKIQKKNFLINGRWRSLTTNEPVVEVVKKERRRFYYVLGNESIGVDYLAIYEDLSSKGAYCLPAYLQTLIENIAEDKNRSQDDESKRLDKDNFVFVHRLPGEKYYCCIFSDGAINPNTDVVFNKIDAKNYIKDTIDRKQKLNNVFYNDLDDGFINEIFNGVFHNIERSAWKAMARVHKIKDVKKSNDNIKNTLAIVALAGLIGFFIWDLRDQIADEAPMAVKKVVNKGPTEEEIKQYFEKKIKQRLEAQYKKPPVMFLVDECFGFLNTLSDGWGFWKETIEFCDVNLMSKSYQRKRFGELTSEFKKQFATKGDVVFESTIPARAKVSRSYNLNDENRQIVSDVRHLEGINGGVFDLLIQVNDNYKVSGYIQPVSASMGTNEIRGHLVENPMPVYKLGSFIISDLTKKELYEIVNRFELDHVFFKSIKSLGEKYEINLEFITN